MSFCGSSSEEFPVKNADSGSSEFTELEKQVMEIKYNHEDTILFVECGYRYRFFGEDAEIASKILNIICRHDHNFLTASIPTFRLGAHIKRLVTKGFKVGIVKQVETSTLKSIGNSKYKPFERKLTNLYTASTLVGDDYFSDEAAEEYGTQDVDSAYLMCLQEIANKNGNVDIGIVAVEAASGAIKYDAFQDRKSRIQLDSCLSYIQPKEIVIPCTGLSKETENVITHGTYAIRQVNYCPRIVRVSQEWFDFSSSLIDLHEFYEVGENGNCSISPIEKVLSLPPITISCISAAIKYLKEFHLERVMYCVTEMTQLIPQKCFVQYGVNTCKHLELFENSGDGQMIGTLYHVLNQTQTKCGQRLLKEWISHPLTDIRDIERRLEMVTEIMFPDNMASLKGVLCKLPDLEKGLNVIFNLRASPATFLVILRSLQRVQDLLQSLHPLICSRVKTDALGGFLKSIIEGLAGVDSFVENLNEAAAKECDTVNVFKNTNMYPGLHKLKEDFELIVVALREQIPHICRTLRVSSFEYTTVHGNEYLIEVSNSRLQGIPSDWTEISTTKEVVRYHSPEVVTLYRQLNTVKELIMIEFNEVWKSFQRVFGQNYVQYKRAIHNIAYLDCLVSFATIATSQGYCRPVLLTNGNELIIKNGWNPIVAHALKDISEPYICNNTNFEEGKPKCIIITGPNMGGKSCYIKQVALITIMAHLGCYVPAESASMSIIDGIYTRMGASMNIAQGRSTFMLELEEVSDILGRATSSSLVILDELGRGTSTHDGTAIACATINHIITEICPLTLFVTHYPPVTEYESKYPQHVSNSHMGFYINEETNMDDHCIVFLYKLMPGVVSSSFGLNTARLAGIFPEILKDADDVSKDMQRKSDVKKRLVEDFISICLQYHNKNTL